MGTTYNVLVIDDDGVVRAFVEDTLEDLGHTALLAEDAFEGVHALKENPKVEMVLLDLMLPYTDGVNVLKKIKAMRPEVKVVVITAHAEEAMLFHTISDEVKEKADGFIGKPFSEGDLDACIVKVLGEDGKYMAGFTA